MTPSIWVSRFAPSIRPAGSVLDVASGSGRHTALFLDRGHRVTAIDRQPLARMPEPRLEVVVADLEDGSPWPLGERRFDAVVVTNYLHRPLFPALLGAVTVGGALIYETFSAGNERLGRPRNPDFLLATGELLRVVGGGFRIVAYECGETVEPRPAVIQRICAVREPCDPPVLPP